MLQMQPRSGRKSTAKYPDLGGGEGYLWASIPYQEQGSSQPHFQEWVCQIGALGTHKWDNSVRC